MRIFVGILAVSYQPSGPLLVGLEELLADHGSNHVVHRVLHEEELEFGTEHALVFGSRIHLLQIFQLDDLTNGELSFIEGLPL